MTHSSWQPGSTAPKDGEPFLAVWITPHSRTIDFACYDDGKWCDADDASREYTQPDLWKPIDWPGSVSTSTAADNAALIAALPKLVEALQLARARISYLGHVSRDPKHTLSNDRNFLPQIDAALALIGKQP